MNNDPRGSIFQQGSIMRIDNALVDEVSALNRATGFLLISYTVPEFNQILTVQNLRLNINLNTVILNSLGRNMCLCNIRPGTWVNAVFSSRMTRSIPPQSNAFLIIVRSEAQAPFDVTTGRIAMVDTDNNFLYTGNSSDINNQIRFSISDTTLLTDRLGNPVNLSFFRPGQRVKITHANFQTASIPPQTAAFHVQLI